MWSSAREIQEGDTVIVWLTRDDLQPLIIQSGKNFNSKFGNYRHSDFIGVPYGSKVASRTGRGFIHLLRPTPELWTMALPHRTQILYLADIAFITSYLNITKGSTVIEAGTGSGSFAHSVIRSIGSSGRLYSYEFHETRARKAKEEFERHGMSDVVTLTHRNVCKDGFTVTDAADSVFLDLPAPWEAVEHAKIALRKDRLTRICCFSPCMEQVLRTVNALNDAGFTEITMYETLIRPHEIAQVSTLRPISEVSERIKGLEKKREEKRQRQIAANKARYAQIASASMDEGVHGEKRKRPANMEGSQTPDMQVDAAPSQETLASPRPTLHGSKRPKTEDVSPTEERDDFAVTVTAEDVEMAIEQEQGTLAIPSGATSNRSSPPVASSHATGKLNVSRVFSEVRGHTSYLTFACLLPSLPLPGA